MGTTECTQRRLRRQPALYLQLGAGLRAPRGSTTARWARSSLAPPVEETGTERGKGLP